MPATSWVAREMTEPDFGDARLNKRLITLLEQIAAQPTASLPQACGSWKDTKAAYRFISSEKVTPQAIRDAHYLQTLRRVLNQERVLALTDTTDLELSSKPQRQGLGPINASEQKGLKVHSVLLASCEGVPLGLVHQEVWARDPDKKGQSQAVRKQDIADKESRQGLTALAKTEWALPETRPVVLIGDREADLYPLFAAPRREGTDLLVRAAYDRRIEDEATPKLRQALAAAPVAGTQTLVLRCREGKPVRTVVLSVRFTTVTLRPSDYYGGDYPPQARSPLSIA